MKNGIVEVGDQLVARRRIPFRHEIHPGQPLAWTEARDDELVRLGLPVTRFRGVSFPAGARGKIVFWDQTAGRILVQGCHGFHWDPGDCSYFWFPSGWFHGQWQVVDSAGVPLT